MSEVVLRAACVDDVEALATVWHEAWTAGHGEHVPPELLPFRTMEEFTARVPGIVPKTVVAIVGGELVGFVTVHEDELDLLFVGRAGRGTGVATTLLHEGERQIAAAGYPTARLEVMEANARGRRFYEREGWIDHGPLAGAAETSAGRFHIASRRYVKPLAPAPS